MSKTTLIIGASIKEERYSNIAANRLKDTGHPIFQIGLKEGSVADEPIYTKKLPFENIDTITIYVGPDHQEQYLEYMLSLVPKRVIFNPGTENESLEQVLEQNGIKTERACTLVLLSTDQY